MVLIAALATVLVACGSDGDERAPRAATAAPTAMAAEQPTAAPAPTAIAADEPTATPLATTRAPETRPQIDATPTAVPVATAVPATPPPAATAKITRVRMANTSPLNESNRIWVGPWSNLVQNDPYGETLIENDEITSEPVPALAKSWEVNAGFNIWTFELNQGIPWHFGFGEFTAADVAHTWELVTRENSNSNFKATWLTATPEVHGDYSISFHFDKPQLTGGRLFSRLQGDLLIQSKSQWDAAEGDPGEAYDKMPAGTGSYQYGGRSIGSNVWFEKIEGDHWAGENPDFQELEWVWSAEQFTRLSMLLAGEVQGSDLSREVQVDAKARGMRVVSSNNENNQSYGFFGGTYLSTINSDLEPWPDGHPNYTGEEPWHNPLVREAFNIAVDRQAIVDEVYFGNASSVYVPVYAPFTEGWSDRWVTEFDEKYGYDPERAIQLLADAGYGPGDLSVGMLSTVIPGNPEIPQLIEVLSTMWEAVGVDTNIVDMELGSWLDKVRAHDIHETFTILRNTPIRTTQEGLRVFWVSAPDGFLYGWEDDIINRHYDCLERSLDVQEREKCARDAGDYMFDDFLTLPLFQTTFDMTIDPEYIAGWVYPGVGSAHPTHVHNIKACPVGTDRCD